VLEKLLQTVLCLGLLYLNLSCTNPVSSIEGTGFLSLNIGIVHPKILGKTKAIIPSDTIITLNKLYFKFTSNNGDLIEDSINTLSFNIRNNIILPIRNYPLRGLKTWNLDVRGVDILDSVIYYKNIGFEIRPNDTTAVNCMLEPRFTIFVARFISTSSKVKAINKIELKIDGVVVGSKIFSPKKKQFNESFAYKYFKVGVSHSIEFLAYTSASFVQYSGGGNFIAVAGQDLSITFPLN
jgi:hypothetical protein